MLCSISSNFQLNSAQTPMCEDPLGIAFFIILVSKWNHTLKHLNMLQYFAHCWTGGNLHLLCVSELREVKWFKRTTYKIITMRPSCYFLYECMTFSKCMYCPYTYKIKFWSLVINTTKPFCYFEFPQIFVQFCFVSPYSFNWIHLHLLSVIIRPSQC